MKKMVFIATAGLGACLLHAATWVPTQPSPDEAAIACINTSVTNGTDVDITATLASNTAEVVIGTPLSSDRHTFLRAVDLSGRTGTGLGSADNSAFHAAGVDDAATGAAILLKRLSGGVHGAGVTHAFGLLAWSDGTLGNNPATLQIDHLTGTVSANVHPDGTAAALYARTALHLNLMPGALLRRQLRMGPRGPDPDQCPSRTGRPARQSQGGHRNRVGKQHAENSRFRICHPWRRRGRLPPVRWSGHPLRSGGPG